MTLAAPDTLRDATRPAAGGAVAAAPPSAPSAPSRRAFPWWTWVAAGLLVAGATWATRDALGHLLDVSITDSESSHVMLVPVIAAWLVYVRRARLGRVARRGGWVGPVVVAVGGAMYAAGAENMRYWTWHAGAVVTVVGAALAVLGTDAVRKFAPAFLVLAFLTPMPPRVGSALSVPMMDGAAWATEGVLNLAGLPVERAGNLLSVGGVEVTVEEACSGMRGVWALALVAVAFAFASPLRAWVRALVVVASPLLALVCNVIRLVPTVWAYGALDAESAHAFHDLAGWVVLFVGYGLLTGVPVALEALGLPVWRDGRGAAGDGRGAGAKPATAGGVRTAVPIALAALLLLGLDLRTRHSAGEATAYLADCRAAADRIPYVVPGGWLGRDAPVPTQAVDLLRPNVLVSRTYENLGGTRAVGLLLVQTSDAQRLLNHYPPNCYPGRGWRLVGSEPRDWPAPGLGAEGVVRGMVYQMVPPGVPGAGADPAAVPIYNFMLSPDGKTGRDMEAVWAAGRSDQGRFFGAGEMQVLFWGDFTPDEREAAFARFLDAARPALSAILDAGRTEAERTDAERAGGEG